MHTETTILNPIKDKLSIYIAKLHEIESMPNLLPWNKFIKIKCWSIAIFVQIKIEYNSLNFTIQKKKRYTIWLRTTFLALNMCTTGKLKNRTTHTACGLRDDVHWNLLCTHSQHRAGVKVWEKCLSYICIFPCTSHNLAATSHSDTVRVSCYICSSKSQSCRMQASAGVGGPQFKWRRRKGVQSIKTTLFWSATQIVSLNICV